MNEYSKDNIILSLTLEFAIDIISYCEQLEQNKKYIIARQLLKSGTSIGANSREAQNAESKADWFLFDLTTSYWAGEIMDWIKTKVEFKSEF